MNRRDSIVGMFCALVLFLANSLKLAFGGQPGNSTSRVLDMNGRLDVTGRLEPQPFRTKPGDPGHGRHREAQDLARALIAMPDDQRRLVLTQLGQVDPDIVSLVKHYWYEYRTILVVGVGAIRARVRLLDVLKSAKGDNSPRVDAQIWDFYEAEQQLLAETYSCMPTYRDEPDVYLLAYKGYCIEKGIPDTVRLQNVKEWDTAMKEEPLAADRDEALNFKADGEISIL